MKTAALSALLSIVLGSVIVVNGAVINADDVLGEAKKAVNGANLHQIATVLEVYYLDHDQYPEVKGGEALIELFEDGGYIRNRPLDPDVFSYESTKNGQDYSLILRD